LFNTCGRWLIRAPGSLEVTSATAARGHRGACLTSAMIVANPRRFERLTSCFIKAVALPLS
jgi:hypothetical protein